MKHKKIVYILLILSFILKAPCIEANSWKNQLASIPKELFDHIRNVLPEGKTILELGSGWASQQLSEFYTVYSVEHDRWWVNKYNTNYIYAPIKNGWYDTKILEEQLPKTYDLILVDGPPGTIGRGGFYNNLHLFNTDAIIIFDDVNRKNDYEVMVNVEKALGRKATIYQGSFGKCFGVIEKINK